MIWFVECEGEWVTDSGEWVADRAQARRFPNYTEVRQFVASLDEHRREYAGAIGETG